MGASLVSRKGGVEGEEEKAGEGEQVEERRNTPQTPGVLQPCTCS